MKVRSDGVGSTVDQYGVVRAGDVVQYVFVNKLSNVYVSLTYLC